MNSGYGVFNTSNQLTTGAFDAFDAHGDTSTGEVHSKRISSWWAARPLASVPSPTHSFHQAMNTGVADPFTFQSPTSQIPPADTTPDLRQDSDMQHSEVAFEDDTGREPQDWRLPAPQQSHDYGWTPNNIGSHNGFADPPPSSLRSQVKNAANHNSGVRQMNSPWALQHFPAPSVIAAHANPQPSLPLSNTRDEVMSDASRIGTIHKTPNLKVYNYCCSHAECPARIHRSVTDFETHYTTNHAAGPIHPSERTTLEAVWMSASSLVGTVHKTADWKPAFSFHCSRTGCEYERFAYVSNLQRHYIDHTRRRI